MKKPILVKTTMDKAIEELARNSAPRDLAVWAADCAERVLHYFEKGYPDDQRPREAIVACRDWARRGVFKMADIRRAALAAHAAARAVAQNDPARAAARSAGQAVATAHVSTHAIAAAIYAASAIRDVYDSIEAATQEREWQFQHLLDCQNAL